MAHCLHEFGPWCPPPPSTGWHGSCLRAGHADRPPSRRPADRPAHPVQRAGAPRPAHRRRELRRHRPASGDPYPDVGHARSPGPHRPPPPTLSDSPTASPEPGSWSSRTPVTFTPPTPPMPPTRKSCASSAISLTQPTAPAPARPPEPTRTVRRHCGPFPAQRFSCATPGMVTRRDRHRPVTSVIGAYGGAGQASPGRASASGPAAPMFDLPADAIPVGHGAEDVAPELPLQRVLRVPALGEAAGQCPQPLLVGADERQFDAGQRAGGASPAVAAQAGSMSPPASSTRRPRRARGRRPGR